MSNNTLCNEIIEKYYASIYRYCFVRLDYNEYAADDCTQEVFLILLKNSTSLIFQITSERGYMKQQIELLKHI